MSRYSEFLTEEFYDREDSVYRSFWDRSGSLHWGYFTDLTATAVEDFPTACQRWTDLLLERSGIGPEAHVLDLGCGNGNTSVYLAQKIGCRVTGVDISGVRIENARQRARADGLSGVEFRKASASRLPYSDETFTHVWSQATLYHVPDRDRALAEVYRILARGGRLVMDDLVTPSRSVTETGQRVVYERLLFEPGLSHREYARRLRAKGFTIVAQADLTPHLRKSYELLADRARESFPGHAEAYLKFTSAIDANDVGWSSFVAVKGGDPLEWVYDASDGIPLRDKYDAWSVTYDDDLADSYLNCPRTAAAKLDVLLTDKDARILDVGAGTGMCGEALASHGFRDLVAIDVSAGMLQQAAQKEVYSSLVRHDIEEPFPWEEGTFDAAVACGVFTFGHARPRALRHVADQLRDGGILVVAFRDDFLASEREVEQTIRGLPLELRSRDAITILAGEPMSIMAFQKRARAMP